MLYLHTIINFRAVSSISEHRKANLQRNLTASTNISADQPVAKRPRISSHCDRGQESDQHVVLPAADTLGKFEADLYQSLGKILNSQGQHSDALHYYRLAGQLQPGEFKLYSHSDERGMSYYLT